MKKFRVERVDPEPFKEKILHLWQDNMIGSPPGRYDWLKRGNPAGETVWLAALAEDSREIGGMISILPREVWVRGRRVRTGILGDFVVDKPYRVFGPTWLLPKAAVDSFRDLGFAWLYTLPNAQTRKIVERVGFRDLGQMKYLVKPVAVGHYLHTALGPVLAKAAGTVVDAALRRVARETYAFGRYALESVSEVSEEFDRLWDRVRASQEGAVGDHSSAYLRWRYLDNPLFDFSLLTCREGGCGGLSGYLVYKITDRRLEIYDYVADDSRCFGALMKALVRLARDSGCFAIYTTVFEDHPLLPALKWYLFVDARYEMRLFHLGDEESVGRRLSFLAGDRNI
ncbi:MAG: hypothetical protein AB1640_14265 [bacterium]